MLNLASELNLVNTLIHNKQLYLLDNPLKGRLVLYILQRDHYPQFGVTMYISPSELSCALIHSPSIFVVFLWGGRSRKVLNGSQNWVWIDGTVCYNDVSPTI